MTVPFPRAQLNLSGPWSDHRGRARVLGLAALAADLRDGEGLQIGYSTDEKMARVWTHREVARADLDPALQRRLGMFGGDLREALTSGMALKLIADLPPPMVEDLARYVRQHRHGDRGRYRFYAPTDSIAPCADMTGICLVGLWRAGVLHPDELRSGAREILRGAAAESVSAADNVSHGGENGPLHEGVLKIYWDDHPDGPLRRRGRKHDAVVVCDGLHAVLLAEKVAGLSLDDRPVPLFAWRADGTAARGALSAQEIVDRSVDFLVEHCESGRLLEGTTYYGCSTFLMALLADLVAEGGRWTGRLRAPLHHALLAWWWQRDSGGAPARESTALALAGALYAARRSGLRGVDLGAWERTLCASQEADGKWPAAPWYRMRTKRLYFGNRTSTTVMALAALSVPA
jgi:hypothetical protein